MLFKLEVIREFLEDAHQIPADSEFDCLKGPHLLSAIPPSKSKEKPQNRCGVCYKKQSSERVSLSLQKLSRSSMIVPSTMFHDILHSD